MKKRLYLVLHSPFECTCAEMIEVFSGKADAGVLLVEDGIYHAVHPGNRENLKKRNLKVYALDLCMKARGYGDFKSDDVEIVDTQRAVELMMDEYEGVLRM